MSRALFAVVLTTTLLGLVPQDPASPKEVPDVPGRRATPLFACGRDETWNAPVPPLWFNIALAADSRLYQPCPEHDAAGAPIRRWNGRLPADRSMLEESAIAEAAKLGGPQGLGAALAYARLRMLPAVGAFFAIICSPPVGPVQTCAAVRTVNLEPGILISKLIRDESATVRAAAYAAIGDILAGPRGVYDDPLPPDLPRYVEEVHKILLANLAFERDNEVTSIILETMGRLPYTIDQIGKLQVETTLTTFAAGSPARVLGAVRGIDALERLHPPFVLKSHAALLNALRLNRVAAPTRGGRGSTEDPAAAATMSAMSRRLALTIVMRDGAIVPYQLAAEASDPDWQVRVLTAQMVNARLPEFMTAVDTLRRDPVVQVRWQVIPKIAAAIDRLDQCDTLLGMLDDKDPLIVSRVLEVVPTVCKSETLTKQLLDAMGPLRDADAAKDWHAPLEAFSALARLDPTAAKPWFDDVKRSPVWRVRAEAARVAVMWNDEDAVVALASDRNVNVRAAALDALAALKSHRLPDIAIEALKSDDYQLVRTAAQRLQKAPAGDGDRIVTALLNALQRLTEQASDTSRDPRVAIIDRLAEFLPPERAGELLKPMTDFDAEVRRRASMVYATLTGSSLVTVNDPTLQRYPLQPTAAELGRLPGAATVKMRSGATFQISLSSETPVTVARFAALVRAGYYNGLTFHRVIPNLVAQAGSASDNDYMGDTRFWRDEAGLERNSRGAVCLSTRGHDSGDGQFFIELIDLPQLDHDHTVFGRVTNGMDVVDRLRDGDVIESITF